MDIEEPPQVASPEHGANVDLHKAFMNAWVRMIQHKGNYKEFVPANGDPSDPANGAIAQGFELNDSNIPVVIINRGESPIEDLYVPKSMASIIMPATHNRTLADSVNPDGTVRAAKPEHPNRTLLSSTLHIATDGGLFVNRHWKFANPNNADDYEILESQEYGRNKGHPSEFEVAFAATALMAAAEGDIHPGERMKDFLTYDIHDDFEWDDQKAA